MVELCKKTSSVCDEEEDEGMKSCRAPAMCDGVVPGQIVRLCLEEVVKGNSVVSAMCDGVVQGKLVRL